MIANHTNRRCPAILAAFVGALLMIDAGSALADEPAASSEVTKTGENSTPAKGPSLERWRLQLGAGIGAQYGVAGVSAEARYDAFRYFGISLAMGGPLVPTATLGLWVPGERFSVGLLVHAGIQPIASGCGTDPAIRPKPECHVALAGANLVLDHDIGDKNGLVLRYGAGFTLIASGGVGLPLLLTAGLAWQW